MNGIGLRATGAPLSITSDHGQQGRGNNDMGLARRMSGLDDEPIAELFQDTSIMFSDIVGEYLRATVVVLFEFEWCIVYGVCPCFIRMGAWTT